MIDYDRRESDDMTAFELQQSMTKAVLLLKVEFPTVEYAKKKKHLMEMKYKPLPDIPIEKIFADSYWDTNPQSLDVLVWINCMDAYLPFVFGSLDGRTQGIQNTHVRYSSLAFERGRKILLSKLSDIYKVIKFRNPVFDTVNPKVNTRVRSIVEWKDSVTKENNGTVNYYYKWSDQTHQIMGGINIQSSFSPTFHFLNKLQPGQPPFFYTLEKDYHFIFFPVNKAPHLAAPCDLPLDITPMLDGKIIAGGFVWPLNLKKMCFPLHAVETIDKPLFKFMRTNYYRNTNRSLNYYVLKESQYLEFLKTRGVEEPDKECTVIYDNEVLGLPVIKLQQTPELIISETVAKRLAIIDWEEYE